VELIDAEWATSRQQMGHYERQKAVAPLYFNPHDAEAHYRLGNFLLEGGQFTEACAHLTAALTFRPNLDGAYLLRAQAASRLQRWDEAAADATHFLEKHPYDTRARSLRADVNRARERPEESAADLNALITVSPQDPVLYERRADCYDALRHTDKAAADRDQALKLGLNNPTRLNARAWRLVTGPEGEREPAGALGLIQKAVDREPENYLFLNTLGIAQYRCEQYATAVVTLEKSMAAGKGQSDGIALFCLTMCHAALGDAAKAKDCFDRAVRWTAVQTDLPAQSVAELKAFRTEAEAALRGK
jgi:tetratricopeptide (TPR) repeat protein